MVKVGEIEMYYEEHGAGEPLLLIMGLGGDSRAWMFQVPDFSQHYRTIVFDNRGVGRTSKPAGPYTIAAMADDTAGLMNAIGLHRAHVVGVSMGGMIAQELALRHPAKVRSLVLGCTYPEPDAGVEQQRQSAVAQLPGSIGADGNITIDLAAIDPLMFFQTLIPSVFNPEFIMTELPKLMQIFSGALEYGFSLEALLGQVHAVSTHKATDRLHQIRVPTMVITGDSDRLIPPGNSDILARAIPNAKLVKIEGGSHGFNFETPQVFNREILTFLASVRQ
jgi:pimeloyl-ACP methyl ester carboxylesterase